MENQHQREARRQSMQDLHPGYNVQIVPGTMPNLKELFDNQIIIAGDGETYYLLLTELPAVMQPEEVQKRIYQFKTDTYLKTAFEYISKLYDTAPKRIVLNTTTGEAIFEIAESPSKERITKMLSQIEKYKNKNYADLFPLQTLNDIEISFENVDSKV